MDSKTFGPTILLMLLFILTGNAHRVAAAPGDLDLSFNAGALTRTDGSPPDVFAVAVQADGKIIAAMPVTF